MSRKTNKEVAEKLEEVLSDPKLFKEHYKNVETVFEEFDKNNWFMAKKVVLKVLKMRRKFATRVTKRDVRTAGELLNKYRDVLLGKQKV